MTGDLSQLRFDKKNRYAKVIHQQGRVFSDADFIEAAYIAAYFEETERIDVIGSNGAPVHDAGFLLCDAAGVRATNVSWANLSLSAGRYYVRGKVAEVFPDAEGKLPKVSACLEAGPTEPAAGTYRAVLEVYERYVAPEEERDQMLDDALRGVDTTGRTRMEWRIRLEPGVDGEDCADVPENWPPERVYPELTADAIPPDENTDPCDAPNLGGYQGLENQLYRVEVFDAGQITWARDNASVLAEVQTVADNPDGTTGTIQLLTLGRDPKIGIQQGDVLEVLTRDDLKHGRRGKLVTNFSLPEGESQVVVNADWAAVKLLADKGFIRRWHGHITNVQSQTNVDIEQGLRIKIKDIALLKKGDYWCIPTRALSGEVLWPTDSTGAKIGRPPFGTYLSTAVLGIAKRVGNNWTLLSDCRNIFYPLTEQTRLLYVGGDGQEAMPGSEVPWPLEVGVVNGVMPVAGAKIQWTIEGEGEFVDPVVNPMKTGADGISSVKVRLKTEAAAQTALTKEIVTARVTAKLLDEHEQVVDVPVHFNLNKSVARNVSYVPVCTALNGQTTVQKAIDRLATTRRLTMEGGDSQVIRDLGTLPLPEPLVVRVWNPCGAVVKAEVNFIVHGGEIWDGAAWKTKVVTASGKDGTASVYWKPSLSGVETWPADEKKLAPPELQQKNRTPEVIAWIADDGGDEKARRIRFTCQLLDARDILYDNTSACTVLKESTNVQDALDKLCANLGRIPERFYNLTKVVAGPNSEEVKVGGTVDVSAFFEGLTFMFSDNVTLGTDAFNRGTVTVEAEVVANATVNGNLGAGTRVRVVLVERRAPALKAGSATWFAPDTALSTFIDQAVAASDTGLMIRVTMRGDYMPVQIGEGLGYLRNATSAIEPRGWKVINETGGPGGNVEFWFWLTKRVTTPTLKIKSLSAVATLASRIMRLTVTTTFTGVIPATGATVTYTPVTANGAAVPGFTPITITHPGGAQVAQQAMSFALAAGAAIPQPPIMLKGELLGSTAVTGPIELQIDARPPSILIERGELDGLRRSLKLKVTATFAEDVPVGETRDVTLVANHPTGGTKEMVVKFTGNGTRTATQDVGFGLRGTGGSFGTLGGLGALGMLPDTGWKVGGNIDGATVKGEF